MHNRQQVRRYSVLFAASEHDGSEKSSPRAICVTLLIISFSGPVRQARRSHRGFQTAYARGRSYHLRKFKCHSVPTPFSNFCYGNAIVGHTSLERKRRIFPSAFSFACASGLKKRGRKGVGSRQCQTLIGAIKDYRPLFSLFFHFGAISRIHATVGNANER